MTIFPIDTRGIYFLWQNVTVVYVGSASKSDGPYSNVWRRITEHRRRGEIEFDGFSVRDMTGLSAEEILEAERQAIRKYRPKYNKTYNKT